LAVHFDLDARLADGAIDVVMRLLELEELEADRRAFWKFDVLRLADPQVGALMQNFAGGNLRAGRSPKNGHTGERRGEKSGGNLVFHGTPGVRTICRERGYSRWLPVG